MGTTSWVTGGPVNSPFASPSGLLGRLAGRFMFWTNRQADVLPVLDVRPGDHVLEVGYGPGALIELLATTGAGRICGVDPSPEMRTQAARRTGTADLRLGSASETGFPDESFDRVVSVNTVALWPGLETGLAELRRVTRGGGRLVIAWHGGTAPSFIARGLRLPEDKLARIRSGLDGLFDDVERHELKTLTVFAAS
jgi:SAM-dependent methyltransferase